LILYFDYLISSDQLIVQNKMIRVLSVIFLLFYTFICYSQNEQIKQENTIIHPLFNKAKTEFDSSRYEKALELFRKIDNEIPDNYELNYYIGKSLYELGNYKQSLKILGFAYDYGKEDLPDALAMSYSNALYQSYKFTKALSVLNWYRKKGRKTEEDFDRFIREVSTARNIASDSLKLRIVELERVLNSEDVQLSPYVSADELTLVFHRSDNIGNIDNRLIELPVYLATRNGNKWTTVRRLRLKVPEGYSYPRLSGMSPDGNMIIFNALKDGQEDLLYGYWDKKMQVKLNLIEGDINTNANEKGASISADGTTIYFSSDRSGGAGKYDIYQSKKIGKNEWGRVQNLGKSVNSAKNDINPFIHPDGQRLYFSSDGRQSLGGYDLYFTKSFLGDWLTPENLGFPINTIENDLTFSVSADGETGYFSTNYFSINTWKNHKVYLDQSIPLTMLKGTILAGDPPRPIKTNLRVIDKRNSNELKYVYNPNPNTGKYIMIFPPGKRYDVLIEAEGYLPHLIEVDIPPQLYFYELFQEVHLIPVVSQNETIGEEIKVKNTFFDIGETSNDDSKNYDPLFQMIGDIISTTDSIDAKEKLKNQQEEIDRNRDDKDYGDLFAMIDKAIEDTDTSALNRINDETQKEQNISGTYFYGDENNKDDLIPVEVGGDTIYTWPTLAEHNAKQETRNEREIERAFANSKSEDRKIIASYKIYFELNSSDIKEEYKNTIAEVARFIVNSDKIGIELLGYTDDTGTKEANLKLSKERAENVLYYLQEQGANPKKAIVIGYGEKADPNADAAEKRLVEIKLFELRKL
jgi:outer membrane protein OmpA-like peptidoglycan-associated protein/tetratricopeptide (TPR) repeat protein